MKRREIIMNIRLLIIISIFICTTRVYAQSLDNKQVLIVNQTIEYLKHLSVISIEWTSNPERKELQKEMGDLVRSYNTMKANVSAVLIFKATESDRQTLIGLLDSYKSDRNDLVQQLLLWKYQTEPVTGLALLHQLDEIHGAAREILSLLQDDKNVDDAASVFLCQSTAENTIVPLCENVIGELIQLKGN